MSEGKDPAIKLFGKTIQLPEIPAATADCGGGVFSRDAVVGDGDGGGSCVKSEDRSSSYSSSSETNSKGVAEEHESNDIDKDLPEEKSIDKEEDRAHSTPADVIEPTATSMLINNPITPSAENESATAKTSKTEEEQSETSNSQEKTLKKPDKILPCPRCKSMDTKFCYYNNYNVNQPRHFCKNCQRYWTAGGTMRNVPVGAGRRKNKTLASQYRQITVTEALPNGLHHPILKPNGTVLTFGSDTPLCESMTSVLKIADKTMMQNGLQKPGELKIPISNDAENTSGSPVVEMQNCHGFSPQVQCFPGGLPGAPWPYPWNPQMGPTFCPPAFPMPFYPAPPYWGCAVPGPWNIQWVAPPSSYHAAPPSGPNSPTLGKHSRDENTVKSVEGKEDEATKENEPDKCLWIPKTLRIDDPDEAAKSSIWATLGIKNDRSGSVNGGGIFKAFQSKGEEINPNKETSSVRQANPAALSRSLNFQESS